MKKILSRLLILCILIALIGIAPIDRVSALDRDINKQAGINENGNFAESILSEDEVSNYIDYEMALKSKHIERLYNEETLSTIVYRNADNTKTVYFFDEDIKFVDLNGDVVEKNIELTAKDSHYTTKQNNVTLKLPGELSDGVKV